jgi:hypothetical protein
VVLLGLLPESRERDLRELKIRQSLVKMLHLTKGYSAPETIDATERAAALAEESGNLRELLNLMIATGSDRCQRALLRRLTGSRCEC